MQTALVQHYTAEFINDYLTDLSKKFSMSPLSTILQNYLYQSDDGTEINRLKVFGEQLYNTIKMLEELPDEVSQVPEDYIEYNQPVSLPKELLDELQKDTLITINPDSLK